MMGQGRHRLGQFLLLMLLANLALAQPLYSLLGEQAEFLVAHDLGRARLLVLAAVLSIVLPALIAAVPLAIGRLIAMLERESFYLLFIVLLTLVFLSPAKSAGLQGAAAIGATTLTATAIAALYWRFGAIRMFFTYLTPAILVFPLVFLLVSRASGIVLATASSAPAGGAGTTTDKDIVFLVLDEFPLVSLLTPGMTIDRDWFPNFARLADMAHWFPGASSGAEGTVIAVPSALTGLPPSVIQGKLPLLSNFPDNLFSRFGQSHRVNATETSTRLCPAEVCGDATTIETEASLIKDLWIVWQHIILPRPWSDRLPPVSNAWAGFGQERPYTNAAGLEKALAIAEWSRQMDWSHRTQQFRGFIGSIEPLERPQLHYLHALLPHAPWNHLPDGRQYAFGENSLVPGFYQDADRTWRWPREPWLVAQAWQRHLMQTQYLDRLLGELLDRLESQGLLDRTLLVVMGDHGGAFVPGEPRREVSPATITDITAVPLFIKVPGQRKGRRHDRDARLQDVLPTVMDALGLPYDGLSLLDGSAADRGPIRIFGRVGLAVSYSFDEHMAHLGSRAAAKGGIFGTGADARVIEAGRETPLRGTAVPASLPTADGIEVEFAGRGLYMNVDPGAAFTPRLVRGEIRGLQPESREVLALAVNGVIQATTRVFGATFAALLGPDALQTGLNRLDAFLVSGPDGSAGLIRLQQRDPMRFTLRERADSVAIVGQDGREIPVAPGPAGLVNIVPAEGDSLYYLSGNIGTDLEPGGQAVVFVGTGLTGVGRIDPGNRTFFVPVPASAAVPGDPLRVFAVPDGGRAAVELAFGTLCARDWVFTPPPGAKTIDCEAAPVTPLARRNGGWFAMLEFADPDIAGLLGEGWGNDGPGIRWSMGKSATLNIPLPSGLGGLRLSARVKPFIAPPELAQQEVWVLANGQPVGSWLLTDDRFDLIEWDIDARVLDLEPGALELMFVTPNARSPRALNAGSDLRELGLAFANLSIEGLEHAGQ